MSITNIQKSREFIRSSLHLHSLVYNMLDIYFFLVTYIRNEHGIEQLIQDESSSSMNVGTELLDDSQHMPLSSNVNYQCLEFT